MCIFAYHIFILFEHMGFVSKISVFVIVIYNIKPETNLYTLYYVKDFFQQFVECYGQHIERCDEYLQNYCQQLPKQLL